ncbi:auxin efflux carrier [Mycena galopus ATCC 62051]|nr:auxin efflux carrier [Mycena galopus ATCC 62051]
MADSGFADTFLAAIQASLSVLLVIFYGAIAASVKILTPANTKPISKICVRIFLPALLITHIGADLHAGSAGRYGIVLLWAVICHLVSFILGTIVHLGFGLPDWTTVALMFNNTISYPLLLITALDETGPILSSLIVTDESSSAAIARAKSYFLVFSSVSSCLTFAIGPRLVDSEHGAENKDADSTGEDDDDELDADATEHTSLLSGVRSTFTPSFTHTAFFPSRRSASFAATSPTTPTPTPAHTHRPALIPAEHWRRLHPRTKWSLSLLADFLNAPLLGALIGVLIGLTPPLHRAFFSPSTEGGIFTAWLTAALKNVGGLFVTLPVVVAGVSLYGALHPARGESGVKLPWGPLLLILTVRFVLWPVLSIGTIYTLASRTHLLGKDPMVWFAMMLMPTGPPAPMLVALVQVSNPGGEEEKIVSKLLAICYLISPILSFTVVGSLRASEACIT